MGMELMRARTGGMGGGVRVALPHVTAPFGALLGPVPGHLRPESDSSRHPTQSGAQIIEIGAMWPMCVPIFRPRIAFSETERVFGNSPNGRGRPGTPGHMCSRAENRPGAALGPRQT